MTEVTINITENIEEITVNIQGADIAEQKAALDNHVETVNKPALNTYVDATSKPAMDTYVDAELKPAMDTYKDEKLQEISDHGTELTGFSGNIVIDGDTYEFENGILKQQL